MPYFNMLYVNKLYLPLQDRKTFHINLGASRYVISENANWSQLESRCVNEKAKVLKQENILAELQIFKFKGYFLMK